MRNYIFVFILLFSINPLSLAQVSQDNFEGNSNITSWFGDDCGIDTAYTNPYQI